MRTTRQTVTIQDVAKTAGVSVSTVSRVLNGKVDVALETQDRIRSVIDELGYTTNLAARSMRNFKKNMVGLIMPDIAYPFAIEVMKGVNRAIAESEFDLLVYTTGDVRKSGRAFHERKYVSLLTNSISDGVVIVAPVAGEFNIDAPIVSIDPLVSNPNYPAVLATNYHGAIDAMEYLLGLGHKRIGFISGRAELESSNRRLKGYREALEKAGLLVDEKLIAAGDYTTAMGIVGTRELLALANPPTAIFASNDQIAIGVYQVAEERGIQIPNDLSVVGFDNIAESKYMGLTTVDQFISEMGYVATQMLIKLINGVPLDDRTYRMQTRLSSLRPWTAQGRCVFVRRVASARPEYTLKTQRKRNVPARAYSTFMVDTTCGTRRKNSPASNVIGGESGPCIFFSQKFGTIIPEQ